VPARRVAFDVSLGRDRHGHVAAVYSRCRAEKDGPGALPGGLPTYAAFGSCRLRVLDLQTGADAALALRGGSGIRSRYIPSIAGNRVAYAGVQGTGASARQGVFVQTIGSRRAPRRLRGGTTASGTLEDGPLGVTLDGERVAYACRVFESPCASPEDLLGASTELWSNHLRTGAHRLIRRAGCPGDEGRVLLGPVIRDSSLLFVEGRNDDELTTRIGSYDLRSRQLQLATAPALTLSVARDIDAPYFVIRQRGRPPAHPRANWPHVLAVILVWEDLRPVDQAIRNPRP
jgi:hypothetical protein